jgi:hypothetical protein
LLLALETKTSFTEKSFLTLRKFGMTKRSRVHKLTSPPPIPTSLRALRHIVTSQ